MADGNVLEDLIVLRLSRRQALRLGAVASATVSVGHVLGRLVPAAAQQAKGRIAPQPQIDGIVPVPDTVDAETVAPGLRSQIVIRWGDPVLPGAPAFDPANQTAAAQAQQFGFNCDYTALLPYGDDWLLWVNHEYTYGPDMIPGYPRVPYNFLVSGADPTYTDVLDTVPLADLQRWTDIELEAHGGSIIRLARDGTEFEVVLDAVNRRITANTPFRIAGPAVSVLGESAIGMLNECAGGTTPWGTVLTTEENFNQYFGNAEATIGNPVVYNDHLEYVIPRFKSQRRWERVYPERFDLSVDPIAPWRYGYIVEIDPSDPTSVPVKHTALGRAKHECANTIIAPDGRIGVYTGDDEVFEYCYKFVTASPWNAADRTANFGLLDEGTLYAARFDADGTGTWLPLVFGEGPLTPANGFASQADICIRTRAAATAVGATTMDRPEDLEVNPVNGHVFIALTNNSSRGTGANPPVNPANPRGVNRFGHIIELVEDGDDATSTTFGWEIFMLCGRGNILANRVADPRTATTTDQTYFAGYDEPTTIIGSPDNLLFDQAGNLFVGTDSMPSDSAGLNLNDALFYVPTAGTYQGRLIQLYSVPAGAECTGPFLSPDDRTLFIAVQHPGEDGAKAVEGAPETNLLSRWPESSVSGPPAVPRPSVVQITRTSGDKIVPTLTAKLLPLPPTRLLDTRDGTGAGVTAPLAAGGSVDVLMDDVGPAQRTAMAAWLLNVTVTEAAGPGYVTTYPAGVDQPYASALNVERAGQTRANLVTVPVGPAGGVTIFSQSGGHAVADLMGVYVFVAGSTDGRYMPIVPNRVFDTRDGLGGVPLRKRPARSTLSVPIAGRAGVPATGAGAVVLNVTITEPDEPGYVTVFPSGTAPNASNVNTDLAGQNVPNQVIVPLASDGSVQVYSWAATHVVADVAGYITDATAPESDSGLFAPIYPVRVRDTRDGIGGPQGKVPAGGTVTVPVTQLSSVPDAGVAAVVANLTITEADGPGFVTAYPTGTPRPYASSANADAEGQTVANHIIIPVGDDGTITLYSQSGAHLVVDVTGYYTS